ncbi:hypothetical protein HanPI659440_Chr12g0478081 [Helianthus annuus]|nr:hypothetical protein HanPI659440_Chr12g0478081 [Helianthus annuus]
MAEPTRWRCFNIEKKFEPLLIGDFNLAFFQYNFILMINYLFWVGLTLLVLARLKEER